MRNEQSSSAEGVKFNFLFKAWVKSKLAREKDIFVEPLSGFKLLKR